MSRRVLRWTVFSLLLAGPGCGGDPPRPLRARPKSTATSVADLRADGPDARAAAAHALGSQTNPAVIEPLVAALLDGADVVRTAAAQAVAHFGIDALGPLLVARERVGKDGWAHDAALEEIGKKISNDEFLEVLTSPTEAVRAYARDLDRVDGFLHSFTLAKDKIDDPRAVGALTELIHSGRGATRAGALRALTQARAAGNFDRAARLFGADEDPLVRAEAAVALGVLADARAVPLLVRALAHENEKLDVREKTVASLGALADARAVPVLQALLPDQTLSRQAARALGALGPAALPALLEALTDHRTDSSDFDEAVARMGSAAVGALIDSVGHRERVGWERVVRILGHIDDPRVVALLTDMIGRDDPHAVRHAAVALGRQRTPQAAEVLLAAFKAGNHLVIVAAHSFFVRQGTPGSEPRLLTALEKEGDREMAETLLNCGNKELADGASAWAARKGYRVQTWSVRGGSGTRWGER